MNGYLLRLAASVTTARASLHPFVGSIYPGSRRDADAAGMPVQEALAIQAADVIAAAAHGREPEASEPGGLAGRAAHRAIAPPVVRDTFEPLVARAALASMPRESENDSESESESARGLPTSRASELLVAAASAGEPARVRSPEARRVEPRIVAEALPASGGREPGRVQPPRTPEPATPTAGTAGLHDASGLAGRTRRATLAEPADIHIHIGRVEVVAVPPEAPRPAPAPARKTMSLDEYLRRRSGGG
ncbi:hypothetical protein SB861_40180 [Paraburkholderia sp. SIMBA_049]